MGRVWPDEVFIANGCTLPITSIPPQAQEERDMVNPTQSYSLVAIGDVVKIVGFSFGRPEGVELNTIGKITNVSADHVDLDIGGHNLIMGFNDVVKVGDADIVNKEKVFKLCEAYNALKTTVNRRIEVDLSNLHNKYQEAMEVIQVTAHDIDVLLKYKTSKRAQWSNNNFIDEARQKLDVLLTYHYNEIYFDDIKLVAVTKPITIKFRDNDLQANYTIPMGIFTVCINPITAKITFSGERKIGPYIHPHILDETACFGTYRVVDMLGKCNYVELLNAIAEFLPSCYQQGWYKDVRIWLPDADKRCHSCWDLSKDCTCDDRKVNEDVCTHCRDSADDCQCTYCPHSGEFIATDGGFDNYCHNECSSYDGEEGRCTA